MVARRPCPFYFARGVAFSSSSGAACCQLPLMAAFEGCVWAVPARLSGCVLLLYQGDVLPGFTPSGLGEEEATCAVQNDRFAVWAGALIALAVIVLVGYVVTRLAVTQPGIAVGVLAALATVLAALPPIIKALRGRPPQLAETRARPGPGRRTTLY